MTLKYRLDRLDELSQIEKGWYDGECEKPSKKAIKIAKLIVSAICENNIDIEFEIYPTFDEGLSFEGEKVEVEVKKDGFIKINFIYDDEEIYYGQ